MTRSTPPMRVSNHLQLHLVSSRGHIVAERRTITRQSSHRLSSKAQSQHNAGDQERITMLKKKMAMKKKTTNPPPILFRKNLLTEKNDEGPKIEKSNNRAHRGLYSSFLQRRGSSSKRVQWKQGVGGTKKSTAGAGNAGGKCDDDTEVDNDSDSGITENGVFTRFFGGCEETSSGSLETTSVLTSEEGDDDDGVFWYTLHSMCGNCA